MRGKPKGLPKSGGRTAGTPNKSTAEIKALAQSYAPEALKELARLATEAKAEQARVSAIALILDRAYGKPAQPISGDEDNPLRLAVTHITREIVDASVSQPVSQLANPVSQDEER